MKYNYINEKELEKFNLIFNLANSLKWDYKDNKMHKFTLNKLKKLVYNKINKLLWKVMLYGY